MTFVAHLVNANKCCTRRLTGGLTRARPADSIVQNFCINRLAPSSPTAHMPTSDPSNSSNELTFIPYQPFLTTIVSGGDECGPGGALTDDVPEVSRSRRSPQGSQVPTVDNQSPPAPIDPLPRRGRRPVRGVVSEQHLQDPQQ